MRMLAVAVALVACGPKTTTPSPTGSGEVIAIVDTTVVPMDRPGELAHHTVVIRDGKVSEVGPKDTIAVPKGARTIDGSGKWLIPGLADMHVHTFDPRELEMFVAMGVTNIRIMWGSPAAVGIRDAVAAGDEIVAPTIFTAGPIVDGNPPVWPGSDAVDTAEQAVAEVVAQKATGYDFIKVYNKLSHDAYAAIVSEGAKNGLPVMGHVPASVGLAGALEAHQRTIEHLDGYAMFAQKDDSPVRTATDFKSRIAMFKFTSRTKLADAVARTRDAGTWNCPTLVVHDRLANLDQLDTHGAELKYVPKGILATWDPSKDFRFRGWTAEDFQTARDGAAWRAALVKQLSDAGARILAGTDVGNPGLVPGYSLHEELELLVKAKLTPFEALRAATSGPAELLGAQYLQGSIKAGVRADLVLLDGDPLADIRNTRKIAGVMLRGRWLPAAELTQLRNDIAAIYAGTKSRFEGVAFDAKAAFKARYAGDSPGVSGEQRISAIPMGSTLLIVGETRFDTAPDTRWEVDAGAEGLGRSIHVTHPGLDIKAVRDGGAIHVTGTSGHAKVELEGEVADDEILAGEPLALDALFFRKLGELGIGEKATFKLAQLEIRPLGIKHHELTAKRLDDASRTVGVKAIAVRVFEISLGSFKLEASLDADGWPVETPEFRRVE